MLRIRLLPTATSNGRWGQSPRVCVFVALADRVVESEWLALGKEWIMVGRCGMVRVAPDTTSNDIQSTYLMTVRCRGTGMCWFFVIWSVGQSHGASTDCRSSDCVSGNLSRLCGKRRVHSSAAI